MKAVRYHKPKDIQVPQKLRTSPVQAYIDKLIKRVEEDKVTLEDILQ